jgi:hypothetical protein
MPTALIGPEPIRRQPGPYRDILEAAGFSLVYPEGDGTLTPDQLRALLPDADVVMAGGERYWPPRSRSWPGPASATTRSTSPPRPPGASP